MARVLIIDDDPDSRILIKYMLQQQIDEAVEAKDGLEALSILQSDKHFDLVVTDIRMPKMNGLTLVSRLRAIYPSIPVILISAHSPSASTLAVINQKGTGYLQKPFMRKQLVEEVNRVF